ncbi:hypothetical protein GRI62_04975 [Erythrobacter arachoides]|uniref:Glycerophosphoryl diester phosphodiesterase membrane domain-containing protein n=1 Tax=Aurantiacibacter arachoides TaxID=1850444 RepID=A0A845A1X3_9SPHN|nr:hypothetical protein [Aurantiacibacter arachoides]MXO92957.1 hypothetical protein [Aurantiacibacter arachoides]GGD53162.1 hypothetical protein GCM10011411_11280 [Aurantiacibacter arachoides]
MGLIDVRQEKLRVDTLLERTFGVIGASPVASLVYVLVIGGLGAAGQGLGLLANADVQFGPFSVFPQDFSTAAGFLFSFGLATASIGGAWLLLRELLHRQGRARGRANSVWAFFGMSILAVLGVIAGLVLFIAPGVIILVRWSAANGYAVGMGHGPIRALKESWEATSGHSWPIFFAGLIVTLGAAIAFGVIVAALTKIDPAVGAIVASLGDALSNVISFAFSVAVFLLVADHRGEVAEVFA